MISKSSLFCLSSLFMSATLFAKPIYQFNNTLAEQRFNANLGQFRCLVCQNQSLLESDAPLAMDLREIIYQKINAGESDQAIREFLVSRYGSFVELKPALNLHTSVLWLLPLLLLFFWLYRLLKR